MNQVLKYQFQAKKELKGMNQVLKYQFQVQKLKNQDISFRRYRIAHENAS
jgi:hypothetical protein